MSSLAQALAHVQRWEQAEAIARSIPDSYQQALALRELAAILTHAQRWEQAEPLWNLAEAIARSIPVRDEQALALSSLAQALAHAQHWEQAEAIARSIPVSFQQANEINYIIDLLFRQEEYERGHSLIERSWLQAETRTFALNIFSSAVRGLVPLKPDIGLTLYQEFQWVDTFLSEKKR